MRVEVHTAVEMSIVVFKVVTPCGNVFFEILVTAYKKTTRRHNSEDRN
jgi:hypothetical protein